MAGTAFKEIYIKFKAKITDDMFMELTPGETDSLLKELLLNSLHNFEFPRVNIYDYNEDYTNLIFEWAQNHHYNNVIICEDGHILFKELMQN